MTRAVPPASSAVSSPAATMRAGVLLPVALVAAYYGAYIKVMSPPTVFDKFAALVNYARVDYDDPASFTALADRIRSYGFLTHCVALPPSTYPVIAQRLAEAGLADDARLVVEKPFGRDAHSARALQSEVTRHFPEARLRRVDHFLAKDVIEGLLTFRFANTAVNAVLDHRLVRSVQITMAEDFDVADRGGFYDATGCLRDVVQNHLLQMLAYFVMDAPRTGSATDVLGERIRALRAVRTVRPENFVRGQYDGYLDVQGVKAGSTADIYCALRTWVGLDRWTGVPFTIRAGKAMAATAIEIMVELHRPVEDYFHTAGAQQAPANLLRFRISPRAGVTSIRSPSTKERPPRSTKQPRRPTSPTSPETTPSPTPTSWATPSPATRAASPPWTWSRSSGASSAPSSTCPALLTATASAAGARRRPTTWSPTAVGCPWSRPSPAALLREDRPSATKTSAVPWK